jgi:hypothetical protein
VNRDIIQDAAEKRHGVMGLSAFCFFAFWFVPSLLLSVFICRYFKKRAATGIAALPFVLL